jgi:hypothetical protein
MAGSYKHGNWMRPDAVRRSTSLFCIPSHTYSVHAILSLRSTVIGLFHLCLGLPSGLFPSGFCFKTLHVRVFIFPVLLSHCIFLHSFFPIRRRLTIQIEHPPAILSFRGFIRTYDMKMFWNKSRMSSHGLIRPSCSSIFQKLASLQELYCWNSVVE